MAIAKDLDRATDSQGDWVAEHTRTYLASGGTEGHVNDGVRTLVPATTGRRTGTPRRTLGSGNYLWLFESSRRAQGSVRGPGSGAPSALRGLPGHHGEPADELLRFRPEIRMLDPAGQEGDRAFGHRVVVRVDGGQ